MLFEKIQKDMYQAMKDRQKDKARALRSALAKLKDKKIENRADLTEAEEIKVIQAMVKQRKESINIYRQGGRSDLVEQESAELAVLEVYLPQMMSEAEVRQLIQSIVKTVGAKSMVDISKVMPEVMRQGAGKINGKLAQQIVRELLQ